MAIPRRYVLNRTHDVSLKWVKEVFDRTRKLTIDYIKSAYQAADIFTKAFASSEKWSQARKLIGFEGLYRVEPDGVRLATAVPTAAPRRRRVRRCSGRS